ncbi:telomerase RNA reverse transcriptase activity [Pristimantis euphronides]
MKLLAPFTFLQLSTQREVVTRVIQRICEKNKNNVLTFGYRLSSENDYLDIQFAPSVCNYSSNTTTMVISSSALWETLLSRVGDDVMMHLLENCSLFLLVPPSCYYQLCGQPIYNVTKEHTGPPPWPQKYSFIYKNDFLSQYIESISFKSKTCSFKTTTLRKNINCHRKWKTKAATDVTVEAGAIHSSNAPVKYLESVGKFTTANRCPKRRLIDTYNIPAKRRKTDLTQVDVSTFANATTKTHSLTPGVYSVRPCDGEREPGKSSASQKETLDSRAENFTVCDFVEPPTEASLNNSVCTSSSSRTSISNILVDFGKLLGPNSKEGFSECFALNVSDSDSCASLRLIKEIFMNDSVSEQGFDLQVPTEGKRKKKVSKRYWQLMPIFQELIENHKRCPYMSLLEKHCPVTFIGKTRTDIVRSESREDGISNHKLMHAQCGGSDTKTDFESSNTIMHLGNASGTMSRDDPYALLKRYNTGWEVYTFVRECLHIVVPESLWGSSRNKCRFLRNVKMIIKYIKHEKISLSKLMFKMKVEDCCWLRLNKHYHFVPASEHLLREKIFSKFLFWLIDTYLIQLLKAFYYITEFNYQKNRLFFYRKTIWRQLQKTGIREHIANVKLHLMSSYEMENMQLQKCTPFISTLRFIPKKNGLRPIVKMCNSLRLPQSQIKQRKFQHFNTEVRNLFSVLNYKTDKFPNLLGSSVFGLDDIYKKWKEYVLRLKELDLENGMFYFVMTDVKGAYNTIPHSKLEEVISKVLNPAVEEVYCIRRYAILWMDSRGQIRKSFKRHVTKLNDFTSDMKCFVTHFQECNLVHNTVFVEQSLSLNENSNGLFALLQHMVFKHILRINDKYYMQCCGIPQGSMLSSLLCSLCYGDMENKLFCGMQENSLFMRLIDDFLMVTPRLEQAKQFLRTLVKGVPEYGCSISLEKTVVNFPIDDIPDNSTIKRLPALSVFSWCGLLLDTQTLEVSCDYSRFSGTSIRSSLSFCHGSMPGENMRNKLLNILQLKCHSIFLDLQVNSLRTVHINVYKILLLQAYRYSPEPQRGTGSLWNRFHGCVIQLPFDQSIKNNPIFFLNIISDMALSCYMILKKINKDVTLGANGACGPFPFESAQWLSCHAFITKLSTHKLLYKALLVPLYHCKNQLSRSLPKETICVLKEVTKACHHKEFSTIKD